MMGGRVVGAAMLAAALSVVVLSGQVAPVRQARVDFTTEIRPLLSDRCFRCHGPDAGKRKAKLRLDLAAGALKTLDDGWAVVAPGRPDRSELIRRVFLDADDEDHMPPAESHLTLTGAEKALLRRWVEEGADYRPHWSFQSIRSAPAPPLPANAANPSPIDAFIARRLADAGLRPAAEASRETVIRRAALTLTGLPPTVAEIDAFLGDASPKAFERVVDRYLASPAYGERMALDWLDLARYADTYGYQADVDRDMSPYRDWVIRAFNDNLPFDQFLTWQLAGDLLPDATRDQRIATAFNRLHRQTNEGGSVEEEFRTEYAVDRVNTFGTAMLGLTLECARCHDHKFDPITQRDYFALFAFFNNIDESGLYSHFTNATPTPALLLWPSDRAATRDQVAARIADTERHLKARAREARGPFDTWIGHAPPLRPPAPVAHLAFDTVDGRDDAGSRGRHAGAAAGRPATGRSAGEHGRRAAVQRRQQRRAPGRPDVRPHRSILGGHPADAHRVAAARGRPAPVARLDRRRQPRLRADARPGPAVLRADPLLARQCDRGPRQRGAAAARLVQADRDLRRLEPRRGHPAVSRRRPARHRGDPRSPGQGHHLSARGRRSNPRTPIH